MGQQSNWAIWQWDGGAFRQWDSWPIRQGDTEANGLVGQHIPFDLTHRKCANYVVLHSVPVNAGTVYLKYVKLLSVGDLSNFKYMIVVYVILLAVRESS